MPIRQLTPEQEERLRLLQQLPRTALSVEQQRERLLLESVRASESAAKKAALLSVIRSNPTAPPEDIALKAAILYKQLKNPLTAQKALEQILAQEPNARVRRAMATAVAQHTDSPSLLSRVVNTVLLPLRALNWLNTQTTGRIWTGIKSAQEGEGFWKGFLHPEEYEEPIFTEEELPENWSPFMKKAVSLVTEIAGGILTDPLTYIGISKIPDFAKVGRWVDKGADVAEAAAKAAKTVEAAQEAVIAASKASRQQLQSWASLAKAIFGKGGDEAARQLAVQDEVIKSATQLLDDVSKMRETYSTLARRAKDLLDAESKEAVRKVFSQLTKDIRTVAKGKLFEPEKLNETITRITENAAKVQKAIDDVSKLVTSKQVGKVFKVNDVSWLDSVGQRIWNVMSELRDNTTREMFDTVDNTIEEILTNIDNAYKSMKTAAKNIAKTTGEAPYDVNEVGRLVMRLKANVRNSKRLAAKPKVLMQRVNQIREDAAKFRELFESIAKKYPEVVEGTLTKGVNALDVAKELTTKAAGFEDVVRKRMNDLLSGPKQAFEAYRQAVEATQPKWTLTWKIPLSRKELILADVQPLAERAKRVAWAVQNMPGIRPVAEWFTRHFRMLAPVPREKMSFEEFEKLSERIPELANVMRSIRGTADFVARKTLDEYLQKIPNDEVAKWVTHLAEVASDQVKSQEILSKIPQELRSEVLKGYSVYQKSIEETTKKMLEAFADAPGFFDNLLQDYVTHIILDPADVAKKKAKAFVARKYGIAEQIGKGDINPFKVIIEQSRGPAQGSSPYFLRKRFFKTIADLKEAGIAVVDDIRIIDSVYKGVADQLMNLKNVEELLRLDGFIRPAYTVQELGWEAADKVFPWLKGQNLAIHPEIVRLFNNLKGTILPATDDARELRQLARAFDTVTNFFKGAVTSTRPSFHVMNTMGNMLLMRMAGIKYADQAKAIKDAISILLGKHPKAKEILEEFMKQGLHGHTVFTDFSVVPAEMAKELMDVLEATTGSIAKKIKTIVWPRRGDFVTKVFAGPRWVGEQVDNVFRLAAFKHFLDSGLTPQQAAKLVRETLFDYSLLTTTERAIRRYVIPFYTWVRNALPRSIVTLLTQPGAVTGYEHMVNAFRKVLASSVDRSQLPEWLQDALILGTDEEGGILYLHPHPPWEELFSLLSGDVITQWFGQKQSESDPGRNLAAMIHPFWSAAWTLISGVDPRTGRKYPEEELSKLPVPIERLLAAAKQFVPWTEIERRIPQVSGRPRITTTKFLGSPVVRYDLPYAQAIEAKKASSLLDEVMRKLEAETGVPLPTTANVSQAERLIDRYSNYVRLIREAQSDPWKAQFINALIQGYTSPVAAMEVLQDNADLLLGSRAEVVMRLRKLLTPENFAKLRVYLGRTPSLKDFFEHRTALESGTLEAVSPEQRRAQALLEELERIRTYGQALQ